MAKIKKAKQSNTAMWIMLSPYLFLLISLGIIPVIMAIVEIPTKARNNRNGGWGVISKVIHDFRLLPAAEHMLGFVAIFVPLTIVFVVMMALMLDLNNSKWKKYIRVAYIIPASISGGVAVLVWYIIFEPHFSPFKPFLRFFGIKRSDQIWQTSHLVWIFAIMAFFTIVGNWILIQYGSLQSISGEVIEAARIDGCNAYQIALRIKLPLIKKYIIYMAVLVFAGGLQLFVEPQLLDTGVFQGISHVWSLDQLSYDFAFTNGEFGSASALSILLLIPSLLGALVVIFKTDMFEDEESAARKERKQARKALEALEAQKAVTK
jgi:multiple sugar transport system permease protein